MTSGDVRGISLRAEDDEIIPGYLAPVDPMPLVDELGFCLRS